MLPVIGGAIQAGSALARKQTYDERRALAVRIAFGKHRILRIAHFARLRFAAAQVFAQFCRHSLFPRHILVFFVSHATRHADNARDAQAWLDIRIAHDNRPRLPSHVIARDGMCCCSSVVERTLGKGEVGSSILPSSTTLRFFPCFQAPDGLANPGGLHATRIAPAYSASRSAHSGWRWNWATT